MINETNWKSIECITPVRSIRYKFDYCCNISCSYCLLRNKSLSSKVTEVEAERNFMNFIKKVEELNSISPVTNEVFIFSGGECTLHNLPKYIALLIETNARVHKVTINTNFLYRDIDFFYAIYKILSRKGIKFKLTVSFHEEFVSFSDLYNKYINLINIINDRNLFEPEIEFVMTNNNLNLVKSSLDILNKDNLIKYKLDLCREYGNYTNSEVNNFVNEINKYKKAELLCKYEEDDNIQSIKLTGNQLRSYFKNNLINTIGCKCINRYNSFIGIKDKYGIMMCAGRMHELFDFNTPIKSKLSNECICRSETCSVVGGISIYR